MKTIEEKNAMIAEFMGLKFKNDGDYISELKEMKANGIYFEQGYMTSELKYHESWDWLMPVVEKIEQYNYGCTLVIIEDERCHIDTQNGYEVNSVGYTKIESVYNSIYQFIEWYNKK